MSKCKVCNERDAVAGYRGKCRHCNNLYHRQWRANNREKSRAYSKSYRERHKNDVVFDNRHKPVPVRLSGDEVEHEAL